MHVSYNTFSCRINSAGHSTKPHSFVNNAFCRGGGGVEGLPLRYLTGSALSAATDEAPMLSISQLPVTSLHFLEMSDAILG